MSAQTESLEKEPDKLQKALCQSNYVCYKAWIVMPKYLTKINKNSPPRNFCDYLGGLSFYVRLYLLMSNS